MYQECSASSQNEKLITTSTDTFKGIIAIKEGDSAVHLCTTHYHALYKQINLTPCASCGAKPKARNAYYRHSPNAEQVSKHFQDAGFEITLAPYAKVATTHTE
jgi:hypothetical protein